MSSASRYRTGAFLIDLDAREIRSGDRIVEVEAKVFDLIALLLAGRDRALTKRELNQALWGDRPVTDAALSQQLRKARRALGDDGDAQAVIRTVHGRGLRWVAPVIAEPLAGIVGPAPAPDSSVQPAAPAVSTAARVPPPPIRSRRGVGPLGIVAAVVLALAAIGTLVRYPIGATDGHGAGRRIAVLPIVDNTGDSTLGWTRSGLMGLMASLLAQQGGVEVVPAETVQAVVPTTALPDQMALPALRRALGATHLVSAELRRLGPIYELDVHLVAAGQSERHETLHGGEPATLAADAVIRLRRWLDLGPPAAADAAALGGVSPFISEAYARGLDALLHGDAAAAEKYFSICLDHDPALAWARLGLASAEARLGDTKNGLDNAGQVAASARERHDPELLVPALRQLASMAFVRGDLDAASGYLDEALGGVSAEDRPLALTDLLVAYGSIEDERGHAVAARTYFERAMKLAQSVGDRRGEASVLINLASVYNGAGDAAGAAGALRAGLEAARAAGDAGLEVATLGNLGATEANQGRSLDALVLFKQGLALARERRDTTLQAQITPQLVWALAAFDRLDDAQGLAAQMLAAGDRTRNPYWQADAHFALSEVARRGADPALALRELDAAKARYEAAGLTRSVAETLTQTVETAAQAGDLGRARSAADQFRVLAAGASEAQPWRSWLPVIAAQVRGADGAMAPAADELGHVLDDARGDSGPAQQAALFQLGRWQLALARHEDLLARPEWTPWLQQNPDALSMHVAALRGAGRAADADAAQRKLDELQQSAALSIDPAWLVAF